MKTKLWYLIVLLLIAGPALGRTWYITPDGNGDAPTIEAGIDSSVFGDTVLVADGEYETDGIGVADGVTLISESGPTNCSILPLTGGTCCVVTLRNGAKVIGFTLGWSNTWSVSVIVNNDNCEIAYNVIPLVGSFGGIGLRGSDSWVHHNTVISRPGTPAIADAGFNSEIAHNIFLDGTTHCSVNLFYCNILAPDNPCINIGNFGVDPLFCGSDNYYLRSDSPALPENSPSFCTEVIGALPQGCVVVPTESKSWGAVKAQYQD